MDVNDVKGLGAEVKRRMDGAIEHARKNWPGCAAAAPPLRCSTRPGRGLWHEVPINQVASLSVPEPTLIWRSLLIRR